MRTSSRVKPRWSALVQARDQRGFTLLEVLIAIAIMLVSFTSILLIENQSIIASAKAKQMNIISMLAKNKMVESEALMETMSFEEMKDEESGQFEAPYSEYTWTRTVKEVEFPDLSSSGGAGGADDEGGGGGNAQGATQSAEMIGKVITKYLSKALREVSVTIISNRGTTEQKYTVSTYWVNLNSEFDLSP